MILSSPVCLRGGEGRALSPLLETLSPSSSWRFIIGAGIGSGTKGEMRCLQWLSAFLGDGYGLECMWVGGNTLLNTNYSPTSERLFTTYQVPR